MKQKPAAKIILTSPEQIMSTLLTGTELYSALPNRIVLVAGFLACVLAEDCATNEVVSQWTRMDRPLRRTDH